jgi:hypothetical protein
MQRENSKFKLVPLYDLQAVLNTWKYYQDGLEAVMDNSGSDASLEKAYNDIMSGKILLWVGFLNGEYGGFVTTSCQTVPGKTYKRLWIHHCYKKAKIPSVWLLAGLRQIEDFARDMGCKEVVFYAKQKPWQEKLVRLGYEPGYIEYIKAIGENDEGLPETGPEHGDSGSAA